MKVLVTGVKGQLGFDVVRILTENGISHIGIDKDELDITNEVDVTNFINELKPTVIIHCAAYTAVDAAEDNYDLAYKVNVLGTKYIVEAAKKIDAKIVYISTDYVFDGKKQTPYKVNDKPDPNTSYGKTKYLGEVEIQKYHKSFIVRIAWVFGINGFNFVKTMLRLAKTNEVINVVSDQHGSPTYTYDLSKLLYKLIQTDKYGIYHVTNDGYTNWAEFAKEIMTVFDQKTRINAIKSSEYPTKAKRPLNSMLSKNKIVKNGFGKLPSWKDALIRFKQELIKNGDL